MTKKNSIKKNYFFNVSYQIFALLIPLITTPYISRVFGANGLGIYSYTYAMVRYFWFASSLGTSTFGTRNIGIYQDDENKRSIYFWNIVCLKAILSIFFSVLYIIYSIFIADNRIISTLQGINLLAVFFDITWLFQGMERFDKVAIKNFVIKIVNVIFIFVFIKTPDDLWKYTLGVAGFSLLGNIVLWIDAKKYIKKIKLKDLKPFKDLKIIMLLFIPSVAVQIFSVIDKSMIGWFTNNSAENGYYEQAVKIVDMSLILITTLGSVMIPKISRDFQKGNKKEIINSLSKSYRFTFALAIPMMIGINAISNVFVPAFFGEDYFSTIPILNILSLLFLFMGLNSVSGAQYLISTNQQNTHTKYLMVGGLINIIANCILIPQFAAIGAAIGSVMGEFTITILELNFLYKTKQFNIFTILRKIWKYVISGLIMFILIKLILFHFLNRIIGLVLAILIGVATYGIVLVLLKDEFLLEELKKMFNKIK